MNTEKKIEEVMKETAELLGSGFVYMTPEEGGPAIIAMDQSGLTTMICGVEDIEGKLYANIRLYFVADREKRDFFQIGIVPMVEQDEWPEVEEKVFRLGEVLCDFCGYNVELLRQISNTDGFLTM